MRKFPIVFIVLLITFSSCKDKQNVDFGYEYFPMAEGHFVEYNVLEIFHDADASLKHDTIRYKLKTKIGEEVLDNSGRKARKFFQFKYDLKTDELLEQRVWTRIIDQGRGEVVEENKRKIRLIFAVKKGVEWDVNAFNLEGERKVYYTNIDEPQTINSLHFESTAQVEYDDFFSLIDHRRMYEVYAKNVGLVKRSFKDLKIQNFDTLNVQKGTEVHYEIVNYGQE